MANGQSPQKKVVFEYDGTGNRILRYVDTIPEEEPALGSDTTAISPSDSTAVTFTVSFFPNPVADYMQITIEPTTDLLPVAQTVFEVRIVNSTTGVVYYAQTHTYVAPLLVDASGYPMGLYTLIMTRGTEVQEITFLKE
jgi:hypothetical protein